MLSGRVAQSAVVMSVAPALWAAAAATGAHANAEWDPKSAAAYLDRRAGWWMAWPGATRDHQTFCISCHTALAYGLARPALREAMGETAPSPNEVRLLDNVRKRVRLWHEAKPYYGGTNTGRSRGTEAVLNALLLASGDAHAGKMSDDTRAAFDHLWALQQTIGDSRGAWEWIQFNNEPWEAHDSQYYGAALAAIAVGATPEKYRSRSQIQNQLQPLRDYLNRAFAKQSAINQAVALWASVNWPDLLPPERRKALIDDLKGKQQTDGGWSVASLVWGWRDWSFTTLAKLWVRSEATPLNPKSDGYATGLIALALEESGLSNEDPTVRRARSWLARNQREGRWPAYSPNGKRNHSAGEGLFMDDAAAAYAVLALTAK